jgi:hypothetical protein
MAAAEEEKSGIYGTGQTFCAWMLDATTHAPVRSVQVGPKKAFCGNAVEPLDYAFPTATKALVEDVSQFGDDEAKQIARGLLNLVGKSEYPEYTEGAFEGVVDSIEDVGHGSVEVLMNVAEFLG